MASEAATSTPTASSKMPYNTRRKSLSLPSLGIHLPVTHASRIAARSPPSTSSNSEQPPSKKLKRSHDGDSKSLSPMSPPPKREPSPPKSVLKYEHTPPPSPGAEEAEELPLVGREIDLDSINDEIVESVVVQLQKTGNKPHLVKQLAELLHKSVKIVEQSANPSAIISSRLSTYLKRSCWSASNPCPLAKELETVHPRRTYFYLTTCRHQPIPDPASASAAAEALRFSQRAIISPSLSSAASRSDEADAERRRELSPSPEVDLSSPELDEIDMDDSAFVAPPTPTGSFSGRLVPSDKSNATLRNHRATSPPLEKDEKEFTQTARGMQKRKLSGGGETQHLINPSSAVPEIEINSKGDDADLFGLHKSRYMSSNMTCISSPAFKPTMAAPMERKVSDIGSLTFGSSTSHMDVWKAEELEWDTRSPEHIELDELDGMFEDF